MIQRMILQIYFYELEIWGTNSINIIYDWAKIKNKIKKQRNKKNYLLYKKDKKKKSNKTNSIKKNYFLWVRQFVIV